MNEKQITFEDIQKANETIKTTDIKGKEYAEVNQRLKAFRMVYPNGSIETEMLKNEDGVCIFKATVRNENGDVIATGTAYEKENSTFINKTSYIENCETSAVGRALGMAGFGIDTSVASADEVQNAIANQKTKNAQNIEKTVQKEVMIQESQKQLIKDNFTTDEIKEYLTEVKKTKLSELTLVEASNLLKKAKKEGE